MATIMEGALWTLTEAAAERMVENGLLTKCTGKHTEEVSEADLPIYHRACDAPSWFGFANIDQAIRSAEEHVIMATPLLKLDSFVEMPNEDELEEALLTVAREERIKELQVHELTLDPTMNPEPGEPGSIVVISEEPDDGT